MNLLGNAHDKLVYPRRIAQLVRNIADLLPTDARVLDVGCGDGLLSFEIAKRRRDVRVEGIDVLLRKNTFIPVAKFDGTTIPHMDSSFDAVILVDVLHHTIDPTILLREARRVARRVIVIKDHTRNGFIAGSRLRLMDWVGNSRHGVVLPYNYWTKETWLVQLGKLGLSIDNWLDDLELYPWWANWLFGTSLHFIACVRPQRIPLHLATNHSARENLKLYAASDQP